MTGKIVENEETPADDTTSGEVAAKKTRKKPVPRKKTT